MWVPKLVECSHESWLRGLSHLTARCTSSRAVNNLRQSGKAAKVPASNRGQARWPGGPDRLTDWHRLDARLEMVGLVPEQQAPTSDAIAAAVSVPHPAV